MNNSTGSSVYYDAEYFRWQKEIGLFGGWANSYKFIKSVHPNDVVIDFGCGGGYLLSNIDCKRKIGIEPNSSAVSTIKDFGIEHYASANDAVDTLGEGVADVIVSNHALEHTLNPLKELINLHKMLKAGGRIHFFVPCDSIKYSYDSKDINYHLFSWSPQNLGNLFAEAGFTIINSRSYFHKWPPYYMKVAKLGWPIFNFSCKLYSHIERSWFQVELIAEKPMV
jgi:SAM-dependent methyltransferase